MAMSTEPCSRQGLWKVTPVLGGDQTCCCDQWLLHEATLTWLWKWLEVVRVCKTLSCSADTFFCACGKVGMEVCIREKMMEEMVQRPINTPD